MLSKIFLFQNCQTPDIEIISIDEKNFNIEYEKKDFGTDKDLSYNEIYNKYMKIVGAYEKI